MMNHRRHRNRDRDRTTTQRITKHPKIPQYITPKHTTSLQVMVPHDYGNLPRRMENRDYRMQARKDGVDGRVKRRVSGAAVRC